MRSNPEKSFSYKFPNFYAETNRLPSDWLIRLKQHLARRFGEVGVEISVLDKDTVKVAITPHNIHKDICEDFSMGFDDGTSFIDPRNGKSPEWISDKERLISIPFVRYIQGAKTKYPWDVLNNIGGIFIVEGRDPIQLMPLIKAFKYKMRMIGQFYIVTKKIPIGTVVINAFVDYNEKHDPYLRDNSYLRFPVNKVLQDE